jgi:nicotinamidase-related amidase
VRHTSQKRLSPLAAWSPGRGFKPQLVHIRFDLQIDKEVNSAFLGKPSLDAWLKARSVNQIITTGVQTNMCVESTARMGSNLGYEIILPLDATYTFDIKTLEGVTLTADHISQVTAANMVRGGFARVVSSADILGSYTPTRNAPEHGQDNSSNEDVQ